VSAPRENRGKTDGAAQHFLFPSPVPVGAAMEGPALLAEDYLTSPFAGPSWGALQTV